jgi:hypothetical protein
LLLSPFSPLQVLDILAKDIENALSVLPRAVHTLLLDRITIWINYTYCDCDNANGDDDKSSINIEGANRNSNTRMNTGKSKHTNWKHSTTHHRPEWLLQHNDNPQKAPGIEIYDAREYVRSRRYWNGYGLLLHEFCHIIHQFVLEDGLDNGAIQEMHQRALSQYTQQKQQQCNFNNKNTKPKLSQYQCVIRRDWLFGDRVSVLHNTTNENIIAADGQKNRGRGNDGNNQRKEEVNISTGNHCTTAEDDERSALLRASRHRSRNAGDLKEGTGTFTFTDVSYALVNEREFFAELSVAFLCDSYHHLDNMPVPPLTTLGRDDATTTTTTEQYSCSKDEHYRRYIKESISPPLPPPTKGNFESRSLITLLLGSIIIIATGAQSLWTKLMQCVSSCCCCHGAAEAQHSQRDGTARATPLSFLWHCNKFYPFTRHQLAAFDAEAFALLQELWKSVESWNDYCVQSTNTTTRQYHDHEYEASTMNMYSDTVDF